MQTIEAPSSEIAAILFRTGSRVPVIVEDEKKIRDLHHQHPERLAKIEYFAPEENESPESLRAKLPLFDYKESDADISDLELEARLDEMPEVFNLPPLSQRFVMAQVITVEPARFYFVDDDVPPIDDEE